VLNQEKRIAREEMFNDECGRSKRIQSLRQRRIRLPPEADRLAETAFRMTTDFIYRNPESFVYK
jgi:hypothetical protein